MVHDTVKVMLLTEIVLYYLSYTAGTGLTDVVEKTTVLFVGTSSTKATNWFVANLEEDFIKHLIKLFVPPRGMLLELGSGQAQGTGIGLFHLISTPPS